MLSAERLHMRAAFFRSIRTFFYQQGFLEVDTPLRQPIYIPESNIQTFASETHYLQSSPELCMKRLLAHGCEKIFQICHCFRKGECGRLHLEEFRMLEWYRVGCDYLQLMKDCEMLLRSIVADLQKNGRRTAGSHSALLSGIELSGDWQRLTVEEAFTKYCPITLEKALAKDCFDEVLVEYVEPQLGVNSPVFLYDYPVQLASLARKSRTNPKVAERFELYVNGVELANGFSELTDDVEQRLRFQEEISAIHQKHGRVAEMPERFLQDLQNLDEAAGIAMGVDRLFMLICNSSSISSAVTFSPEDFC